MRTKLAMFLVLAGGVAGCASSPPPPPPMAMAPEPAPMPAPAPAPMTSASMAGAYTGTVEAGADNGARCRKMGSSATARVRGNAFTLGGMRGKVAPDGTVSSAARRGGSMTGTLTNGTLDATETMGSCSYHYVLNKA